MNTATPREDENRTMREHIRKMFEDFSQEHTGEPTDFFSDECPDCHEPLIDGKCVNLNCFASTEMWGDVEPHDHEVEKLLEEERERRGL